MKILMITPAFPPIGGSHMQRMLNFANALSKNGVELHVLACKPSEGYPNIDAKSKKLIDKNIKVYYVPEGFLHRKVRNKNEEISTEIATNNYSIKVEILKKLNKIKKSLLIPDTMVDWYWSVIDFEKKNSLVNKIKPDAILSCSMPNTSHLIGYKLSKKYNIDLIMDYGDPWAYEISVKRGKIRFKLEYKLEKKILNHSILSFVATEATKQLYIDKYKLNSDKVQVAMMGYYKDDSYQNNEKKEPESKNSTLSLNYGGALNPIHRNPIPFLKAVSKVDKNEKIACNFRVDNISELSEVSSKLSIEDRVTINEFVPFTEFINESKKYDILVLFGNSSPMQISGKVFNYMATGKRIFYIKNMDSAVSDPTEEILKKYKNVTISENTVDEILEQLNKLILEKKNRQITQIYSNEIDEYSWENQGLVFYKGIKKILLERNIT
ncbi:hypothetical protein [Carnobacterium sp. FSL E2-0243]|uniref:hypothetical protein n=1 Tax=Carnobacterium sp. FSL E2-0243 TaxID=2921365 RepID=UPI0030F838E1